MHVFISIALYYKGPIQQLDVKSTFIYGDLYEEIYMDQPPKYVDLMLLNHVCHMH